MALVIQPGGFPRPDIGLFKHIPIRQIERDAMPDLGAGTDGNIAGRPFAIAADGNGIGGCGDHLIIDPGDVVRVRWRGTGQGYAVARKAGRNECLDFMVEIALAEIAAEGGIMVATGQYFFTDELARSDDSILPIDDKIFVIAVPKVFVNIVFT
ncbi:hypothetical protein CU669_05390 [Paramagnetospirillum kuznetsovii]|uniref:Uncharacterized protein n=1 Tax=Paramagnetospirillum kuznetsovii TaxID=2053833 RepID=A0A364P0J2_9PROT|nr:hypothetical protein CU669_05390 [Paramagnetospirillum kuznetsovii]